MFSRTPYHAAKVENYWSSPEERWRQQEPVRSFRDGMRPSTCSLLHSHSRGAWRVVPLEPVAWFPAMSQNHLKNTPTLRGGLSTDGIGRKSHTTLLGSVTMVTSSQSALGPVPVHLLWVSTLYHNNSFVGRNACEVERPRPSLHSALPLGAGGSHL